MESALNQFFSSAVGRKQSVMGPVPQEPEPPSGPSVFVQNRGGTFGRNPAPVDRSFCSMIYRVLDIQSGRLKISSIKSRIADF